MENKDYPGKILHGDYSPELKTYVTDCIRQFAAFDRTSIPVILYLCAWEEPENAMWYEFAGKRFRDLLGCSASDLADVFRQCIVERRVYDYQDEKHTRINQQTLRQSDLSDFRKRLRELGEKNGHVEAIYKVQLAGGEMVWLKDQATVTAFDQDRTHVSSGCLTVLTKEMEAEEALKKAQKMLREKARALNLAKKIQDENATRLSSAIKDVEAARKEAEKANKAKSEFLAVISHEIRNPMNGIMGTCDLIMADELSRQQTEYLEIIRSSAFSLLGLINDILDFSKIEAGKLKFREEPFNIRDVVEDVSDIFLEMITRKNLELIVDIDPDVPEKVIADPMRLRQVLINLTSNALKFTRQGEIIIRVEPIRREKSVIDLSFRVTDTGIGIDPEHFENLFESFTQISGTAPREYTGTGLGLAICRQIVEMMNGSIGVDSYPGQGSTFYFNVPLKFQKNSHTDQARPSAAGEPRHALVAMKNRSGRQALVHLLESWGFTVAACGSASRTLDLFFEADRSVPYALLIMDMGLADIKLPGISSKLETMVKAIDLTIALNRMGKNEDVTRSDALGFTRSLTRPVKQSVLKNVVQASSVDTGQEIQPPETEKTPPSFSTARVLLVEDDPANLKIGSEMLRMAGVTVDTAQNGFEAIEKAQKNDYDAVLIDIQMPHLDGIEATRVIRQHFSKTRLPVIAMSAHAKADNWKACLEAGINDYILKPISRKVLFTALKNQISPEHRLSVPEPIPCSRQPSTRCLPGMASLPGLDIGEGLERLGGELAVYADILSDFCQTYEGVMKEMNELLKQSDFTGAADLSHSLKGASGNVSAMALFESAKALELACREKNEQTSQLLLESVHQEYETVCQSARQFCERVDSQKTIEEENSSAPAVDDLEKQMDTFARFLMDSLDQCDPVLSENLVQKMAPHVQDGWEKEMHHLKEAVGQYQFDDARKWVTILMEKAGIWK